jgi:hypothetical protein
LGATGLRRLLDRAPDRDPGEERKRGDEDRSARPEGTAPARLALLAPDPRPPLADRSEVAHGR